MDSSGSTEPGEVTELLHRWNNGDRDAEGRLYELVQPELHRLAAYYMRGERSDHTLQPTALLNETYIKISGAKRLEWRDRQHFYALAARAMRRLLIDYARGRRPETSPGDDYIGRVPCPPNQLELAIAVDELLGQLATEHPEQCAMVELKFFLGLSDEEAAETLQLPLRTAQRRWRQARKWLFDKLESESWKTQLSGKTSGS
jgi:RNA polymerase sigma-70 factor, ECF subfamily